jgi:IS30 family transposase
MRNYQQLAIEEREAIQLGLWEGKSIRSIAFKLGRSPSTVSREISKNAPPEQRRYAPRLAHKRAKEKIKKRGQRRRLKDDFILTYVVEKLKEDYSPEQIAGRLKLEHPKYLISHEAIYQFIYSQYLREGYGACCGLDLRKYLKRKHKVRKRKYILFQSGQGQLKNRVLIDERPKEIEERNAQGHWEGDSLISKKSHVGLNSLVERVSGLVFITKIKNGKSAQTTKAVIKRLREVPPELRKTLTLDNGSENAGHEDIAEQLNLACYFAHPYHSWERGTNENTNGLIRYYLPKGTDFAKVKDERIQEIENKLNDRPRKRLGFRTPSEVFNQCVALKC